MDQQNAADLLRKEYQTMHQGWLEPTLEGLTQEQANWIAPGRSAPIAAQYAHHLLGLDFLFLGFVRQGAPLAASSFAGKTGLSEPYPAEGDWYDWARKVQIDWDALRKYAQAVYTAFDGQLARLTDEDLAKPIDMTSVGFGQETVGSFLTTMLIHGGVHTGEIAVIKGLQGMKGYPF
jgi:hypothetical protein